MEHLEDRLLLAGDVLYRVNAGGSSIADDPSWEVDTSAAPSNYTNAAAAESSAFSASASEVSWALFAGFSASA